MLVYFVAFLAGVVTAISPCAYPVLPIVFAGGASGSRRRPYAIIAGLVFAPCGGPILSAVAGATASTSGVQRFGLALAYALGAAVPLLTIAVLARRSSERLSAFRSHVGQLRVALGVVIGAAALLITFGVDTSLQRHIGDYTHSP